MKYRKMKRNRRNRIRLKGLLILLVLAAAAGTAFFRFTAQPAIAGSRDGEPRYKYYTSVYVEPGDSLWSIAEEHLSADYDSIYSYIDEVMAINHLSDDFLRSGTRLCIPYYSAEYR